MELLVGGKDTTSLIDGDAILTPRQLSELGLLKLESAETLKGSYIRLRYKVISFSLRIKLWIMSHV